MRENGYGTVSEPQLAAEYSARPDEGIGIFVYAKLPNLKTLLRIPADQVEFRGRGPGGSSSYPGNPTFSIDRYGRVHALRFGTSLLETTYAGVTALNCVVVTDKTSRSIVRDHCEDLLLPDETLAR